MRRLLLLSFVGITLLALAVSVVPFVFFLQSVERDRVLTALERDGFVLAGKSEEALESRAPADLVPVRELASAYREAGGARVIVVDTEGVAVVTNDPDEIRVGISYASRPEIQTALKGSVATGERVSETLGLTLVYVAVPVFSGPNIVGAVRLTYDKQFIDDEVNRQFIGISLVILTTLAVGILIAIVLSRALARGMRELENAALSVAKGDFSARAKENVGPPEVRALSVAFNEMALRAGKLMEQQKAFASDASHQLRTPLTALMLRFEGLRDSLEISGKSRERFDAIESELTRLARLIDGLLALGRSGAETASPERVVASAIVKERATSWASLADEAHISLDVGVEEGVVALAVPTAIDQIVDIYLDNALSVSPAGSAVELTLTEEGSHVVLEVKDRGPGLSPDECERAFDRFWRGSSHYEGTGLGLAIVLQLARASRADVSLTPREGGGIIARAVFRRSV
jgi:signal transduction histidine kinase